MDLRTENRATRRQAAKYLEQQRKTWPDKLKPLPKSEWGETARTMQSPPFEVMRSKKFLVQLYPVHDHMIRMSVCRCSVKASGDWNDAITWDELQRLKAEAGLGDRDAVEIYPKDNDVVNVANMRHLWVFKDGSIPFAWRKKGGE